MFDLIGMATGNGAAFRVYAPRMMAHNDPLGLARRIDIRSADEFQAGCAFIRDDAPRRCFIGLIDRHHRPKALGLRLQAGTARRLYSIVASGRMFPRPKTVPLAAVEARCVSSASTRVRTGSAHAAQTITHRRRALQCKTRRWHPDCVLSSPWATHLYSPKSFSKSAPMGTLAFARR
jgi:hypothetical protein